MKNRIKAPSLVTILTLSLITIIFWLAFEVYRAFTTKPSPPVPREVIAPISPVLDIQALNNLANRIFLSDSEIVSQPITTPTTTQPTIAATPEATTSALPSPVATSSPEASPSGQTI